MTHWTRKDFLKASLTVGSAALLPSCNTAPDASTGPKVAAKLPSANGDVRIAVAGINGQGGGHMRDYLTGRLKGARLVALCDADLAVLNRRKAECEAEGGKVRTYQDFRKLLEDPEVDAIVCAPPNHWHSLMAIWGMQAGKDIYIEKPLSHNMWEGRQVVAAAKKYSDRIAVAGMQNRSSHDIVAAIEYIRAGKLGKILWARGLCYKTRDSIGRTPGPQPIPATVDYDLWTGPADLTPPRRNSRRGSIHYDWHWFWNYGGGDISNQGIHQMDVARWMLGEPGLPPSVISFGGRYGYLDDAETPNTLVSVFNYEKAPLIFEVRGLPTKAGMRAMDRYRQAQIGVIVQCEGGYVHIGENGSGAIYDNDNKRIEALTQGGNGEHRRNFVKALRERKGIVGQMSDAHASTALCHLGNLSYLVGAEKSNADVTEAIKASEPTKEAFARVLDHLKANNVDVQATKTFLGPLLKIDAATEEFVGAERDLVAAANSNPVRKRTGRAPFAIPQLA